MGKELKIYEIAKTKENYKEIYKKQVNFCAFDLKDYVEDYCEELGEYFVWQDDLIFDDKGNEFTIFELKQPSERICVLTNELKRAEEYYTQFCKRFKDTHKDIKQELQKDIKLLTTMLYKEKENNTAEKQIERLKVLLQNAIAYLQDRIDEDLTNEDLINEIGFNKLEIKQLLKGNMQ